MEPRIKSPALTVRAYRDALLAIDKATEGSGIPRATLQLLHARVAQINGCSVCVDMHTRALKKLGESDTRIFTLAAWREAPYFTEAERAALALAEATTRISDRASPVPDEVWKEAARHFNEEALGALVMTIAVANLWNRINVATQQITGEHVAKWI